MRQDMEAGNTDVGQNEDDNPFHGGYAAVDQAVDTFVRSLDETFAGGLYQYYVRRHVDLWKNSAYVFSYCLLYTILLMGTYVLGNAGILPLSLRKMQNIFCGATLTSSDN